MVGRVVFLTLVVGLTGCGGGEVGPDQAVLDAAYRHPEGQGYSGDGIGIPVDIVHAGQVVRAKEGYGTNSLGYTFAVMWEVAKKRGLLNELYLEDFETFRRDWYRADPETESRGLVGAMERVGIGYEVPFADAQPGDFLILGFYEQRGPSAVFLDWVHHEVLAAKPPAPALGAIDVLAIQTESHRLIGRVFYLHAPDGFGRSKLAAGAERALGVDATARNHATVAKLLDMLADD